MEHACPFSPIETTSHRQTHTHTHYHAVAHLVQGERIGKVEFGHSGKVRE